AHGGNSAQPVEVIDDHAVLGAVRGHAHHFQRAQVGGHERQPRDPPGNRAAGEKEILARFHAAAQREADAQHESEVDDDDRVIDGRQMHSGKPTRVCTISVWKSKRTTWIGLGRGFATGRLGWRVWRRILKLKSTAWTISSLMSRTTLRL